MMGIIHISMGMASTMIWLSFASRSRCFGLGKKTGSGKRGGVSRLKESAKEAVGLEQG